MFYPEYYFNFDAMDVEGFIYSDPHFLHSNIIKYEKRPFKDVDEMNTKMAEYWNSKVTSPNSIVIVGGDMFMERKDTKKYLAEDQKKQKAIISQLNGAVAIAKGNHDNPESFTKLPEVLVADQIYFTYHGKTYWLEHAPPDPGTDVPGGGSPTKLVRSRSTRSYDVALCGHVHSQWLSVRNTGDIRGVLNIGADLCNYTPRSLAELEAVCKAEGLIK